MANMSGLFAATASAAIALRIRRARVRGRISAVGRRSAEAREGETGDELAFVADHAVSRDNRLDMQKRAVIYVRI